jgi:hypothetical protein
MPVEIQKLANVLLTNPAKVEVTLYLQQWMPLNNFILC